MAPKRRPAAAVDRRRDRGVRARPAAVVPPEDLDFSKGGLIEGHRLTVSELPVGTKIFVQAVYWDREVELTGEIVGVSLVAGQLELRLQAGGTSDEGLLRWLSGQEDRCLRCHLCARGCSNSPTADDYIHLKQARRLEVDPPAWGENLKEAAESEALRRLAEESGRREKEARGKGVGAGRPHEGEKEKKEEEVSSSSTSSSKKKKKGKKKKKKKKSKRFRVQGKKDLKKVFEFTGLDPSLKSRKRVMRLARRAMKNRNKEDSESSSCSGTDGSSTEEAVQHLFEETHKIRRAATRGPGALTAYTVSSMSKSLLTQQGLPIEESDGAVPCIALQYHKQVLSQRLSPPLARESLNICAATDAILGGQVALGLDILVQRLKSIEALGAGQSWAASQKLELAPQEGSQLAALEESRTANRELREELKNRQASQKTWQKGEKGGSKGKQEETKGKGKREKGGKEKGKGEREKEK